MSSPLSAASASRGDRVGEVLADRYQLVEVIGRGGSGVVYRAVQASVEREVAVKVLFSADGDDAQTMRHFEREARIIGRLRHPNTICLYDCGRTQDGAPFIVTELLCGTSLVTLLKSGPLPLERVVLIAQQIAGSLAEAHGAGIVHRDIKPENVFLDNVDGQDFVKVLDFGIAHEPQNARLTRPGLVLGTPTYMAPEQAAGDAIDRRTDVYGLGVLIYQMITGSPPFVGATALETLAMHLSRPPARLWVEDSATAEDEAALDLETLVLSMMAKSPDDRPQSMAEVRKTLEEVERTMYRRRELKTRATPNTTKSFDYTTAPTLPLEATPADAPAAMIAMIAPPPPSPAQTFSDGIPFDSGIAEMARPPLATRLAGLVRNNHLARIGLALIALALIVALAAKFFVEPHG